MTQPWGSPGVDTTPEPRSDRQTHLQTTQGPARSLGQLLRAHRVASGLTQEQLAELAGLSVRGLSDLERGVRRYPYSDTLERLSEALHLSDAERASLEAARRTAGARTPDGVDETEVPAGIARPATPHVNSGTGIESLPYDPSSFVGRDQELAALESLLETTRLLTLVGPGGVGKTRLAIEVARRVAAAGQHEICLVDLVPLSSPELVAQLVAQQLGLRVELDHQPGRAVLSFLATREFLLIVDNCEHLIDASAELLLAILQRCASVRILATSREPLGIAGERVWRLTPLEESSAMRLFIDRAQARGASFDSGDRVSIGQVCQSLDHLPLAIELAAARVGLLRPAEILLRLEDRFALLKRVGGRGVSPRQQTLRSTIDWSFDLLEPAERQLFCRLSVCAGSFDVTLAEAMGAPDALDVLSRLVDKSLVVAQTSDVGTRYRLLDSLQRYGSEHLERMGDLDQARQRHLDHFLARAEQLFRPTDSIDGPSRELDGDLDNLRSAFEWCLRVDPQAGLRLVAATRDVWWRRSQAEGRRWAGVFLERCPQPSLARAQALQTAGVLVLLGDPRQAHRLIEEARRLAASADRATTAMADYQLGFADFVAENATAAIVHLERALAAVEDLGDIRASAVIHVGLAWTLLTDGERREEARARLERARQLGDDLGDRYVVGLADYGLGLYWRWINRPGRAMYYFRRSLAPLLHLGVAPSLSAALLHIARLMATSEPARAARLAGAGLAVAERVGVHFAPRLQRATGRLWSDLEARLGREQLQQAWTDGERLSMSEAVNVALFPATVSRTLQVAAWVVPCGAGCADGSLPLREGAHS